MEEFIDVLQDYILLIKDGKIKFYNKSLRNLLGDNLKELNDLNILELLTDKDKSDRYIIINDKNDKEVIFQPIIKNIIIEKVKNSTLNDGTEKGRQTLDNIGEFDGYYITNGKAIEIKCIKNSRSAQTVYEDLEGNEINVNDGKTFIQICPIDSEIEIEGLSEQNTAEEVNAVQ